jgi:uncharacterized protein (DUF433 family)
MEVWNIPMYSSAMAGRLVSLTSWRVRRWLKGYNYSYVTGVGGEIRRGHMEPVIKRDEEDPSSYASFLELIDLLFVKKFLDYGISLQRIRKALDEAEELIGDRHFARENFFTDGKNIYLEIYSDSNADALLELLSGGQWVIATIIKQLADQIDFDEITGFAQRWYPLGPREPIVIDPRISFGNPSIVDHGIATANVYDLYLGERSIIEPVCEWLSLKRREVEAAVTYETQLAAA